VVSAQKDPGIRKRPSVLVVDDDEVISGGIASWLRDHYEVVTEPSAAGACGRLAVGERFSVILADVLLPGMDGLELYECMRGACPEQTRRVIFITGAPALRLPFHRERRVLLKPFDRDALLQHVQAILSGD